MSEKEVTLARMMSNHDSQMRVRHLTNPSTTFLKSAVLQISLEGGKPRNDLAAFCQRYNTPDYLLEWDFEWIARDILALLGRSTSLRSEARDFLATQVPLPVFT